MSKYQTLLNIINQLRKEAPTSYSIYYPPEGDTENLIKARSRAFIHLFLMARFGLLSFQEREENLIEGPYDGGIDAYYIDPVNKIIYFVQSKFRTTEDGFIDREIKLRELLKMDVDRITNGETVDTEGNQYNSKVLTLIDRISNIGDIGRYKYLVILIANIRRINEDGLKKITGGFPVEIYNFERCYSELMLPVIKGVFYKAKDLFININLGGGSSSINLINYPIITGIGECNVNVAFVPIIEIAKVFNTYKNSILEHNPRNYLELSKNAINREIAKTILDKDNNEFALFNNGITMLSDSTDFNLKTAIPNIAQLAIKNPQIINGGQTGYTLSEIYRDIVLEENNEEVFRNKEILLKIITFSDPNIRQEYKLELIEEISKATNQQTLVTVADRMSNKKVLIDIQEKIFTEFGYYFERKRGEFYNGLSCKYIDKSFVIDRETFIRICYACNGRAAQARRNSENVLFKDEYFNRIFSDSERYKEYFFGYKCLEHLFRIERNFKGIKNNKFGLKNYGSALRYGKFAVISVAIKKFSYDLITADYDSFTNILIKEILNQWLGFEKYILKLPKNIKYFKERIDPDTGEKSIETNYDGYYKGSTLELDLELFKFK